MASTSTIPQPMRTRDAHDLSPMFARAKFKRPPTLLSTNPPSASLPSTPKSQKQREQFERVCHAAIAVVGILKTYSIDCCAFGSLACKLFGNNRPPKDADMLILQDESTMLPPLSAEAIKVLLVMHNSMFYIRDPVDPSADYKVLYYRTTAKNTRHQPLQDSRKVVPLPSNTKPRAGDVKVDILLPGEPLSLPNLPRRRIVFIDNIPCLPFPSLLLQKLQSWDDHRKMKEHWKRKKKDVDAADLRRIVNDPRGLGIKELESMRLSTATPGLSPWWQDTEIFDDTRFLVKSVRRVKKYCEHFPDRGKEWGLIGFDISPVDDPSDLEMGTSGSSGTREDGDEEDE